MNPIPKAAQGMPESQDRALRTAVTVLVYAIGGLDNLVSLSSGLRSDESAGLSIPHAQTRLAMAACVKAVQK